MQPRLDYTAHSPAIFRAMLDLEARLAASTLPAALVHLVKLRVSIVNGCAYCLDMHWKDLRALGESEQRLYGLVAWQESPYYTEAERAALAWADALTRVDRTHAPDVDFERLRAHFDDAAILDLTWAIGIINTWNRLAIGLRTPAGRYVSRLRPPAPSGAGARAAESA
jgi:AhpD family alkylhydroperoxidase